jgi:cytoskeletal protein CcmA (bactofilin family)
MVTGVVKAKEKLLLESQANLNGDLFTKILVVESGAKFEGKSKMGVLKDTVETKDNIKPDYPLKS